MTMQRGRGGLGRGLEVLFSGSDAPQPGLRKVSVDAILPNPRQPRQRIDEEALRGLASSIKELGLIQPLIVSQVEGEGAALTPRYQLIAGERRLRAAKLAGLTTVPVVVREASPLQLLELALVENVQRADLNVLEEAEAYRQLVDEFSLTQGQIAERVGKSRVAVTNTLRLLALPDEVKGALSVDEISEGHARALLGLDSDAMQVAALKEVKRRDLSVRSTEELVRRLNEAALAGDEPAAEKPAKDPHLAALEEDFRRSLGTKVELTRSSRGGRVTIFFYSDEELEGIYGAIVRI